MHVSKTNVLPAFNRIYASKYPLVGGLSICILKSISSSLFELLMAMGEVKVNFESIRYLFKEKFAEEV